jgi:hypothetical protein
VACIRAKFGIAERGRGGARAAFLALSAHIRAGGLFMPDCMIRLGDYIDLEGGLEVGDYQREGRFRETAVDYRELGGRGTQLRLEVTGINPFHSGGSGAEEEGPPHVAFQFYNIPVLRRMNASRNKAGGYAGSDMRRYLVDADGDGTGGAFLAGLLAAGVPREALWAPERVVSSSGKEEAIVKDLLWLPLEGELFGGVPEGGGAEGPALFERSPGREGPWKLHNGRRTGYWTASVALKDEGLFVVAGSRGRRKYADADRELGCAPAFCVW